MPKIVYNSLEETNKYSSPLEALMTNRTILNNQIDKNSILKRIDHIYNKRIKRNASNEEREVLYKIYLEVIKTKEREER